MPALTSPAAYLPPTTRGMATLGRKAPGGALLSLFLASLPAGCGGPAKESSPAVPSTVDSEPATSVTDDTGETGSTTPCGGETDIATSAPAGAAWWSWDDDRPTYSMKDFAGRAQGYTETFNYYKSEGWEAVRFEFSDPGVVYAVSVHYAELPEEPAEVTVGIYADFGWNGFDFHPDQPLWTGVRCLSEADVGWVEFAVDPPLSVNAPALVHLASWRDGKDGPSVSLDSGPQGDGTCSGWDDCHSALNYPLVDESYLYNGLSLVMQYDFLMRMQVETPELRDHSQDWFQVDPALSVGGNVAWGDYDDDGDDDLMAGGPVLYRNDGGVFTDVSAEAGVNSSGIGTAGGVWGDLDNDGCLDYFGMSGSRAQDETGRELLLRSNCDGTFSDITLLSGIDDLQESANCLSEGVPQHSPTYGAAWIDLDNDGFIDLAMANFLCFDDYSNYPDRFWHNNGDGTFSELTDAQGFVWDAYAGRGAAAVDADLDGDLDLMINNYTLHPNLYYENQGDGTVAERALELGLGGLGRDCYGPTCYGHTIGTAWGDLDQDGDWDAVHANLAHPRFYHFSDLTNVLIQDGGTWTDEAAARGIHYHETHSNPSLLDFDNDGDLDLTITEVYSGRPMDVYVNDGSGYFANARYEAGFTTENGWGTAVSDYDNDGDEDLVAYSLFRNDHADGHWIKLRLEGVRANRAALGAIAWVTAGGVTGMRSVSGGNGVGNQDSATLLFGLGDAATIESVEVWFPGGDTVRFDGLSVDQAWRLREDGTSCAGLAPCP